jgi:hypothetical protein
MLGSVNHTFVSAVLIAALVLAVVVGLNMFWKSKTKDLPKDTRIQENAFRLSLPGKWVPKPSSDPTRWVYQNEDGRLQLTVSLLSFTHRMSSDEQTDTLNRVVGHHRRAQTEMPDAPAVTMTEATFAESGGVLAARYGGIETAGHRRFASLLLCNPVAVTIYYYEGLDSTEAEFEAGARTTMNSIVVPR